MHTPALAARWKLAMVQITASDFRTAEVGDAGGRPWRWRRAPPASAEEHALRFMDAMISSVRRSVLDGRDAADGGDPGAGRGRCAVPPSGLLDSGAHLPSVSCASPADPGVITPPVAMSLITSTPALSCSRTAFRASGAVGLARAIAMAASHADKATRGEIRARRKAPGDGAAHGELDVLARRDRTVVTPLLSASRGAP
jgi:hypothetical protein